MIDFVIFILYSLLQMDIVQQIREEWGDREVYSVTKPEAEKLVKLGGIPSVKATKDGMVFTEITLLDKKYILVDKADTE